MALQGLAAGVRFPMPKKLTENTASIMTSEELNESRARALNEVPGNLKDCDCKECKNKGYVAYVSDNGTIRTRTCRCMAARDSARRIRESGLSELLEKCSLDKFLTDLPWQKKMKSAAEAYLEKGGGKWFMVSGTPGTGKTFLCTAICGEMLKRGDSVRYFIWRKDAPRLKSMISDDYAAYEKSMRDYTECDVLYIDDFFKGKVTEADINLAFELLNARYNRETAVGTIISSELEADQILCIDEGLGSRIVQRARGYMILTPRENLRLKRTPNA